MNTPLFYIFLFAHLAFLILGFGAVMVIDTFGLLWLAGRKKMSEVMRVADVTQPLIWIGWCGMVLSGSVLIYHKGYLDPLTQIKVFLVILIGLNGIFLHTLKKWSERVGDKKMPARLFFRTLLATSISQLGWWGALIIGFVHRHIQHKIAWPENPIYWMAGIVLAILLAAAVIETTTSKK